MAKCSSQVTSDNIDINKEILSGLGTFHATQIAALRTAEEENKVDQHIDTSSHRNTDFPSDLHDLQQAYMTTDKPQPVIQGSFETKWYELDQTLIRKSSKQDLLWIVSHLCQENPQLQQVLAWSSFNQILIRVVRNNSYWSTWTVILRCLAMTELINGKYTVITVDKAPYCKTKMLRGTETDKCKSLVLMLGGCHTQ